MSTDQNNRWEEQQAIPPGAFNNMLERMNNQFTPNHESQHYQSGFIPATNPPWTAHQQNQMAYTQHNQPHLMGMDSSMAHMNHQAVINSSRSYSITQDSYPENRTPLLRSSSDVSLRMGHYPNQRTSFNELDGILDHSVESFDGSVFLENLPLSNSINASNISFLQMNSIGGLGNQPPPTTQYSPSFVPHQNSSDTINLMEDVSANNFTTKLSLGTWISPLDQNILRFSGNSESMDSIASNMMPGINVETQRDSPQSNPSNTSQAAKPSYSDVLAKAPSQESKSNSNGLHSLLSSSKNINPQAASHQKNRTSGIKSKGRRCNSPISNNIKSPKFENGSFSKVGLDNFDLPGNITSNYSIYMNNFNNNSKGCTSENIDKVRKRSSLTSEESSPVHQPKKGGKNEKRNTIDKLEDSTGSSDLDKSQCDKLNNHTISTQQKQTPKRTSFINNNLTSTSSGNKSNNSDSCRINLSKKNHSKEDNKSQNDGSSVKNSSSSSSTSVLSFPSNGSSRFKSNRASNNSTTRTDRSKESLKKYNNNNKRKKESSYFKTELLMTGWSICLLWLNLGIKAGLWLTALVVDVIQMSWSLSMHFIVQLLTIGNVKLKDLYSFSHFYAMKTYNFLLRKKEKKTKSGLEQNLPLPVTGDDAMNRLLACKGKDPYNILGVAHSASDEDIKKYYKRQAFLVHPDKNKQPGAEEAFKILAHAFELIGEPEKRKQYDNKFAEEVHLEGAWGELNELLSKLKEKIEEAANTIRCTNCNKRHKRVKVQRPTYAARVCAECHISHAAREGDIWAEKYFMNLRWKYLACMDGAIYDISQWAACQRENLKHLQANTHSVQYRIVSGRRTQPGQHSECPTDPELEEFFNNLYTDRFRGQNLPQGANTPPSNASTNVADTRKRKFKKKK